MKSYQLLTCLSGSRAYGTDLPESDTDIRGIFCAEPKFIRTPFFNCNELSIAEEEDTKYYELTNFMKLFVGQNPNIMEILFCDDQDVLRMTSEGAYLRMMAPDLLSKESAKKFCGFANGQLKRITGHNKWIMNPQPDECPAMIDHIHLVQSFLHNNQGGMTTKRARHILKVPNSTHKLIPYGGNMYGLIEDFHNGGCIADDGSIIKRDYKNFSDSEKSMTPIMIVSYDPVEHEKAKKDWTNYWEWKKNRNPVRHSLEEQFGYDTKHGMHIVRLLRMAEEILTEGTVIVRRHDADELKAIRAGSWTLQQMLEWAEEKSDLILGKLYKESTLPETTDLNLAADILMEVQESCWKEI